MMASRTGKDAAEASATTDSMKALSSANTQFTLDLYRQLVKDISSQSNVFYSPFSISAALAMTYAGARQNTAAEMKNVLHFSELGDDLHQAFADTLASLNNTDPNCQLHIANRLYVQSGFDILDGFSKITSELYGAGVSNVDYVANAEDCRGQINEWVESQTNRKIKDLIPPGVLNGLVRLVLVNAIYFKANWLTQFDKKFTRMSDFFIDNMNKISVSMMYVKGKFRTGHFHDLDSRVLEIPYVGENLFMYVILPNKKDGLTEVEYKITAHHLTSLSKLEKAEKTDIFLPRFKLEESYDLVKHLKQMGIVDLFSEQLADLSGVDGTKELYVSNVMHKAFVEVNEEGTEAAAATAVILAKRSVSVPNIFRVDRPFLFLIKDMHGSVLFIGRVTKPPAEKTAVKEEL